MREDTNLGFSLSDRERRKFVTLLSSHFQRSVGARRGVELTCRDARQQLAGWISYASSRSE